MTYTKGTWKIKIHGGPGTAYYRIVTEAGDIAHVLGQSPHSEAAANARLISQAPAMLEVLRTVLPLAKDYIKYLRTYVGPGQGLGWDERFAHAETVIALAESENAD